MHLSELNKFADNLYRKGIVKKSSTDFWALDSKDLWIYDSLSLSSDSEKRDYGSLGLSLLINVTDTYRSLRPQPNISIPLKHEDVPAINVVDSGSLSISKVEEMKKRAEQDAKIREFKKQG